MTPITSYGLSFTLIFRPTTSGDPPYRRCHSPWLMTATRTPFSSSSSVNTRPISGFTPSTLQRLLSSYAPGPVRARHRRRAWRRRLGDRDVGENRVVTPPLQPFGGRGKALRDALVAQIVPDHDETVRVRVREGTNQDGIEGAEHRRDPADAERQCCDGDGREARIAAELAQSEGDVARELLQARPAPRRASVLLHECEVAQFPARRPSRLVLRQPICSTLVRFLFEVELKFLAQFGILVGPFDEPAQLTEEGVQKELLSRGEGRSSDRPATLAGPVHSRP